MNRVSVDVVWLVPTTIAVVMGINQWGLWSRIMISFGMEELALTVIHD
jgi:hypothetical protein